MATPTDFGALVREARERRGWTQTDLGTRIGASRFWVAEFERGKPGAELGLALRAVAAVGVRLRAEGPGPPETSTTPTRAPALAAERAAEAPDAVRPTLRPVPIDLDEIVGTDPGFRVGEPAPVARPRRAESVRE